MLINLIVEDIGEFDFVDLKWFMDFFCSMVEGWDIVGNVGV